MKRTSALFFTIIILFTISMLFEVNVQAENWPNWRGPTANGLAAGTGYPAKWSKAAGIAWKFELPGLGSSTPIVWEDRIFVTCGDDGQNALICLDRDGKVLWKEHVALERQGKHRKASGSNSSPVTDGKNVFVYFKSGDLAAFDFAGKKLWQVNLQEKYGADTLWWDLGTSPVLTDKHVVIACMQSEPSPSYLAAFDKQSGEEAWKVERNLNAPVEANQSYSTPTVLKHGNQEFIFVLGADHITAHAASDGKELWRVGGLNPKQNGFFRSIASPVLVGDILVAPYARGATLTAVKLGGSGDVTQTHVLWTKEGVSADVPTPVAIGKNVIVSTDDGRIACLQAESGEAVWEYRIKKPRAHFSASPIVAGDRIYLTSEQGDTFVIQFGGELKQPELVSENSLEEFIVATPVLVDGRVLIRTEKNLYCISD